MEERDADGYVLTKDIVKEDNKEPLSQSLIYKPEDVFDNERMDSLGLLIKHNIKFLRQTRNLSTLEMSSKCNLPISTYTRLEDMAHGTANFNLMNLVKVSIALGIPLEEFIPIKVTERTMSNGEQFTSLTRNANPKTIDFLLYMCEKFLKFENLI